MRKLFLFSAAAILIFASGFAAINLPVRKALAKDGGRNDKTQTNTNQNSTSTQQGPASSPGQNTTGVTQGPVINDPTVPLIGNQGNQTDSSQQGSPTQQAPAQQMQSQDNQPGNLSQGPAALNNQNQNSVQPDNQVAFNFSAIKNQPAIQQVQQAVNNTVNAVNLAGNNFVSALLGQQQGTPYDYADNVYSPQTTRILYGIAAALAILGTLLVSGVFRRNWQSAESLA